MCLLAVMKFHTQFVHKDLRVGAFLSKVMKLSLCTGGVHPIVIIGERFWYSRQLTAICRENFDSPTQHFPTGQAGVQVKKKERKCSATAVVTKQTLIFAFSTGKLTHTTFWTFQIFSVRDRLACPSKIMM